MDRARVAAAPNGIISTTNLQRRIDRDEVYTVPLDSDVKRKQAFEIETTTKIILRLDFRLKTGRYRNFRLQIKVKTRTLVSTLETSL